MCNLTNIDLNSIDLMDMDAEFGNDTFEKFSGRPSAAAASREADKKAVTMARKAERRMKAAATVLDD